MKKLLLVLLVAISIGVNAQSPLGAWERIETANNGDEIRTVVIFSDGYQVAAGYNKTTGAFMSTNGGTWKLDGNTLTETKEFDSSNPETVGQEISFEVAITQDTLTILGFEATLGEDWTFKRIDNGTPGDLQGAWLMSGRKRDGKIQQRDTNRPRKTMKMLSGTRFQWIAYNTETKQFMGTGGGSYTTKDGKYTENIEFFSRDNTRVGASLEFDYDVKDGDWHHSGFSSKGAPLYEIWSVRKN